MFITWNLLGLLHGFFPKWFGVGGKDRTHHTTLLHEWSWPTFWCRRKRGQQMQKGVGSQSGPRQNHHSQQESKRLREWKWNHSKHLKTNQGDSVAQTWVTNGYGLMEPYVFHSCILGDRYFWHLLTQTGAISFYAQTFYTGQGDLMPESSVGQQDRPVMSERTDTSEHASDIFHALCGKMPLSFICVWNPHAPLGHWV